jgi:hypothetical protein
MVTAGAAWEVAIVRDSPLRTVLGVFAIASSGLGLAHAEDPPRTGLVIVAPQAFHSALEPYRAYRAAERPTEMVALEDVLATAAGSDDPERLKRWLFDAWKTRGVRYVLLVGDADVLPVRYMVLDRVTPAAFDYAFYPSDLYYADVATRSGEFEDWNASHDGFHAHYYGEVRGEKNKTDPINYDAIDYRPELALGRWPVSTAEAAGRLAAKTLAYEQRVLDGTAHGLRRAAFVAVPGWVDARGRMDAWLNRLPDGWTGSRLFGASTTPPDEAHVVDVLNEGASLVFHAGHGHDNGWEGSMGVGALQRLANADGLPVVLSAGCSTARFATLPPYEPYCDVDGREHAGTNAGETFDAPPPPPATYARGRFNPTGLGERLVRDSENGAVAYIGCNTGSQPCGLTLLDGFSLALRNLDEPRLGDCWARAVDHYFEAEHLATIVPNDDWYPASIFFQGMKFMVFGDPTLRLPGPEK